MALTRKHLTPRLSQTIISTHIKSDLRVQAVSYCGFRAGFLRSEQWRTRPTRLRQSARVRKPTQKTNEAPALLYIIDIMNALIELQTVGYFYSW